MELTVDTATELARDVVLTAARVALPALAVGLVVGLLFSVLQAITQVHEQTLSFIPKLFAVGGALFALLPWLLDVLTEYTRTMLERIGSG